MGVGGRLSEVVIGWVNIHVGDDVIGSRLLIFNIIIRCIIVSLQVTFLGVFFCYTCRGILKAMGDITIVLCTKYVRRFQIQFEV